jgi:phenylacetyl-CoA:acceptor oxidoreductase subunit 2
MSRTTQRTSNSASPRLQQNWDWRAAANFIAGGAGGGLLLCASLVSSDPWTARAVILLGLMLIGAGLTCVWFEIGRPLRALNVYRHFASSWMTREAVVAALLFPLGGLSILTGRPAIIALTSLLGAVFVYCQANMLSANKGIPAWRHPRAVRLVVTTGLAEGAGLLLCIVAFAGPPAGHWPLMVFLAAIAMRAWSWKSYLAGLTRSGAPDGALRVLHGLDRKFLLAAHLLPALAVAAALANAPLQPALVFFGGALAVAGGWLFKFDFVRRAAFTQGLALHHLPVRGQGEPGPAVKPGWSTAGGANAG